MKHNITKLLYTAAISAIVMAGCTKDDDFGNRLELRTVPFSSGSNSKVAINNANSNWIGGEKINVNGNIVTVTVEGSSAYIDGVTAADRYLALYPTSLTATPTLSNNTSITLPQTYHYATSGGHQQLETPMAANITSGPLMMNHLTGALTIKITNISDRYTMVVDSITIISDKYQLSGNRTVDFNSLRSISPIATDNAADRRVDMVMDFERLEITSGSTCSVMLPVASVGADNHFTVRVSSRYRGGRYIYSKTQSTGGALASNQLGYAPVAINTTAGGDITKNNIFAGTGTAEDPYLISTPHEFMIMAEVISGDFPAGVSGSTKYNTSVLKLTDDIDMSGFTITPITYFQGTLDGNGHTVSNLNVVGADSYVGLFGSISTAATVIKGLTIDNMSITSSVTNPKIGAIIGYASFPVTLKNCTARNITLSLPNMTYVIFGGMIGKVNGTKIATLDTCKFISDLYFTCTTSGSHIGGMIGEYGDATLTMIGCETTIGTGSLTNCSCFGGMIGYIGSGTATTSTFTRCSFSGTVSASSTSDIITGGMIGNCVRKADFNNCNVSGSLTYTAATPSSYLGSFIGTAGYESRFYTFTNFTDDVVLTTPSGTIGRPIGNR